MVKQSENSVRYDILINDFHKKIKTFKNGRHIYSRTFKIGQSKFQIEIYPNGDNKKDKGNVGVFLRNQSQWRLYIKAKFHTARGPNQSENIERYYDPGEGYGFPTFLGHNRCSYSDLDEGSFEIQTTITVLEEEVTAERDMTGMNEGVKTELGNLSSKFSSEVNNVKKEVDDIKEDVHGLTADTRDVKEELRSMKRLHDSKLDAIQKEMTELKLSMQATSTLTAGPKKQFECPMCTEEAKPPMRLKQCGEGHIICDTCFAKDEEARQREGRQRNQCGVCRRPITGRPTALESLLGLS